MLTFAATPALAAVLPAVSASLPASCEMSLASCGLHPVKMRLAPKIAGIKSFVINPLDDISHRCVVALLGLLLWSLGKGHAMHPLI